ncbi:MAG: serine/threonine-protein kinase, partial [Polyangiales bacterium]
MQPPDLIAGRFRLETRVGAGAMGVVYRARDEADGGTVAVKTLRSADEGPSARFLREAAALAGLEHPVIIRHVAHGLHEGTEPYLALEWIDGSTLATRVRTAGLTPLEAIVLALRLVDGLCALHAQGIVHRDLKPGNLMLPGDDVSQVRILDLGIARFADASTELTVAGSQLGTPRYMAPEQVSGGQVDHRVDLYAFG